MKKLAQIGLAVMTSSFAASAFAVPGTPVRVDEPGTLLLLTVGLATAFAVARKFRK